MGYHLAVPPAKSLSFKVFPAASRMQSVSSCRKFEVMLGDRWYPLVNVDITMENHHFNGSINYIWAMFNRYVSLPKGVSCHQLCPSIA